MSTPEHGIFRERAVPEGSLLHRYAEQQNVYTDCFELTVPARLTIAQFVEAFYTTWLFRLERIVLTLAGRQRITDAQVRSLAEDKVRTFAIWRVEARNVNELLLSDDQGHTRSYLATVPSGTGATCLVFGSAVVPRERQVLPRWVRVSVPLHRLYSKALLHSAALRLRRG